MHDDIARRYGLYETPWALIGKHGTAIWSRDSIIISMNESRTTHALARNTAAAVVKVPDMLAELHECGIYFQRLAVWLHSQREFKAAQDCKTRVREIELLLRSISEGGK